MTQFRIELNSYGNFKIRIQISKFGSWFLGIVKEQKNKSNVNVGNGKEGKNNVDLF